ncbi:MAG: hypothetical protein ACRDJM_08465 [Actinomycetota bacterium]
MHDFAIVALLGLAAYKTVDFLTSLVRRDDSTFRLVATLGVGVIFTELLDYSVFAAWGIGVRETWMGPVFTGLIVGGMSYAWHELLGLVADYGQGRRDEDRRTPRAA